MLTKDRKNLGKMLNYGILAKSTAFHENQGFRHFRVSVIFYCP